MRSSFACNVARCSANASSRRLICSSRPRRAALAIVSFPFNSLAISIAANVSSCARSISFSASAFSPASAVRSAVSVSLADSTAKRQRSRVRAATASGSSATLLSRFSLSRSAYHSLISFCTSPSDPFLAPVVAIVHSRTRPMEGFLPWAARVSQAVQLRFWRSDMIFPSNGFRYCNFTELSK